MMFTAWIRILVVFILISMRPVWADEAQVVPADLFYSKLDTSIGSNKAQVTVVEFFDYQCGYCRHLAPVLEQLARTEADVRIVYRETPFLSPDSVLAAKAALAAALQHKYILMHRALIQAKSPLTQEDILELSRSLGLNEAKLVEDINNNRTIIIQLQDNLHLAQVLNLRGVPTLVIAPTPKPGEKTVKAQILIGASLSELQHLVSEITRGS